MIEISAQPKLKVSNFHLGIAFIQNQSPMKTGVTMNQKAKIQFETNKSKQGILLPSVGSARHEDGGKALLDNPGKGALITTKR